MMDYMEIKRVLPELAKKAHILGKNDHWLSRLHQYQIRVSSMSFR